MRFELRSPIPGTVQTVSVSPGDPVEADTPVMNLETMKIDIPIAAGRAGKIAAIHVKVSQLIEQGDLLLTIDE